jgi:hypothetical protein
MQQSRKPKMLMALSPENIPVATALLGPEYSVVISTSLEHAQALLTEKFDVIAATACFDESRMFDFLRYCKATPGSASVPFIAMRLMGTELDSTAHQGIHIAAQALGAEGFIDLHRLEGAVGRQERDTEFRHRIRALLERRIPGR